VEDRKHSSDAGGSAEAPRRRGARPTRVVDEREQSGHWREHYRSRPYVASGEPYERYEPAYRYGWESCCRFDGQAFDEAEPELRREWDSHRGRSELGWMEARPAARDAWDRVEEGRVRARGKSGGAGAV
jgi:hypothetical protein